jgi:hypothetical protein
MKSKTPIDALAPQSFPYLFRTVEMLSKRFLECSVDSFLTDSLIIKWLATYHWCSDGQLKISISLNQSHGSPLKSHQPEPSGERSKFGRRKEGNRNVYLKNLYSYKKNNINTSSHRISNLSLPSCPIVSIPCSLYIELKNLDPITQGFLNIFLRVNKI